MTQDFEALYDTTYPRLVGIVTCVCGSRSDAEDVVQEAFARLFSRWDHIKGYDNPEAWLRTVSIRLVTSGKRRQKVARLGTQRLASFRMTDVQEGSDLSSLVDLLSQLSIEQRAVTFLHYVADLPLDEIASVMELPVGTVKSRLARARTLLRPLVGEETMIND